MSILLLNFADKCRLPYYGGCDFTRECVTTTFGQNCGSCLPGLTPDLSGDPIAGPCIRKYYNNRLYTVWPPGSYPAFRCLSSSFLSLAVLFVLRKEPGNEPKLSVASYFYATAKADIKMTGCSSPIGT